MKKRVTTQGTHSSGNLVVGKHALEELLAHNPGVIQKVYALEGEHLGRHKSIIQKIENFDLPIEYVSSDALNKLSGTDSHQSFVAIRSDRQSVNLKRWLEANNENSRLLVVALDSILDPHNTGAIFRASECFGVDLMLWSKNRSSGITPVVTAVSVGATELVPYSEVSNLAQAIGELREAGFQVVVADEGEGSIDLNQFEPGMRTLLVLGSEEHGVQDLIRREAEFKVKIPMKGKIASLNVSQAAAVILSKIRS